VVTKVIRQKNGLGKCPVCELEKELSWMCVCERNDHEPTEYEIVDEPPLVHGYPYFNLGEKA